MKCSLGISNFLEEISSPTHSVLFLYFFALIAEEGFLISSCYSLVLPDLRIGYSRGRSGGLVFPSLSEVGKMQKHLLAWVAKGLAGSFLPNHGQRKKEARLMGCRTAPF